MVSTLKRAEARAPGAERGVYAASTSEYLPSILCRESAIVSTLKRAEARAPGAVSSCALMRLGFLTALLLAATVFTGLAQSPLQNFITARDGQLLDGDQPFRFISFNIPNLLLVEDNMPFTGSNAWRLPDAYEITDGLATVKQMGGTVVRTYTITVVRGDQPPAEVSHVLGPGQFNETAFRSLDQVLQIANEQGVRLIIPLVNNWPWMGGRGEYAKFRGKTQNEFWTDPQLIADFKETIRHVLTRTNTLTGVPYNEDKAILCWETGNELDSPAAWTREIAAYIKSLDHHHLVLDGNTSGMRSGSLDIPDVDMVTTHHYSGGRGGGMAQTIRNNAAQAKGKKLYLVGEFGFVPTAQMADAIQAIRDSSAVGGLLWSLRFHNRDGGFYWHSEDMGGNRYKAFHWPGSPVAADYDEINFMTMVRTNAFAIRGLTPPPIPVPAPPKLLSVTPNGAISWQGSVGASGYQVEFNDTNELTHEWSIWATNVDESATQYQPQLTLNFRQVDNWQFRYRSFGLADKWYFRVRALNEAGRSEPSNIIGPVRLYSNILVADELADFAQVKSHTDGWKLTIRDSRSAKEDATRAVGQAGDALTYALGAWAGCNCRVYAYFPHEESEVKLAVSQDGQTFQDVPVKKDDYSEPPGDNHYWKRALFHAENIPAGSSLRITLTGETQIGRVEITQLATHQ